jgi:ParB/RepB/Spo0J family partition protein
MSEHVVAGLKVVAVNPTAVRPNPWNPNRMDEETFRKEVESIRQNGFVDPITVREADDGYELIDGEHRTKAAAELGLAEIPAINLGPIPDQQAKKLTVIYNELKGRPEPDLLAKLMRELSAQESPADLAATLPYTTAEIDTMVQSATEFDWDAASSLNGTPTSDSAQELADRAAGKNASNVVKTGAEERRFVLGGIQGTVPVALADALAREFNASVGAVGSKTVEVVLADWLERLRASPPKAKPKPAPAAPKKAGRGQPVSAQRSKRGKAKESASDEAPDHEKA